MSHPRPPYPGPLPPGSYPGAPPVPPPAPPRRRRRGRLLLVLVLVVIVGLVLAALISGRPTRAPAAAADPSGSATAQPGAIVEKGRLSAVDLREGDCYNTFQAPPPPGESQAISSVEAVPCTSPHTDQVIAKIVYGPTVPFAEVEAKSGDCLAKFKAALPRSVLADRDRYHLGTIAPANARSWQQNPVVACTVSTDRPTSTTLLR